MNLDYRAKYAVTSQLMLESNLPRSDAIASQNMLPPVIRQQFIPILSSIDILRKCWSI